jgi:hypothetical protein
MTDGGHLWKSSGESGSIGVSKKTRAQPRTRRGKAAPVTVKRLDGEVLGTVPQKRLRRREGIRTEGASHPE